MSERRRKEKRELKIKDKEEKTPAVA